MIHTLSNINPTKAICFFTPKLDINLRNPYLAPEYHNLFKATSKLIDELQSKGFCQFITDGNFGFVKLMDVITRFQDDKKHHIVFSNMHPLSKDMFPITCRATTTDIRQFYAHEKHTAFMKYQQVANETMIQNSSVTVVLWRHTCNYTNSKTSLAKAIRRSLELQHPVILIDPKTFECKTIHPETKDMA